MLKLGASDVGKLYFGSSEVKKLMLGTEEIFAPSSGYDFIARGSGTNFPLTSGNAHEGEAVYFFAVITTSDAQFCFATREGAANDAQPIIGLARNGAGSKSVDYWMGATQWYRDDDYTAPPHGTLTRNNLNDLFRGQGKRLALCAIPTYNSNATYNFGVTAFNGSAYAFSGTVHDVGLILQSNVPDLAVENTQVNN